MTVSITEALRKESVGLSNPTGETGLILHGIKQEGKKFDQDKPDLTLVPVELLEAVAGALGYGVVKYGRGNYELGLEDVRLIAACLRHIYAHLGGEELDSESGQPHLGHAAANLGMYFRCQKLGTLKRVLGGKGE